MPRVAAADRDAAGPAARAVRHLVQRLPAARRLHRGGARRDHAAASTRRRTRSPRTCRTSSTSSASRRSARSTSPSASPSIRRAAPATPWARQRRGDKAHLRTRVGTDGMDYKGYNIAVHELGHNVEQTFSLYDVPFHAARTGVPNTAFTEALAFVFQDARPRAARPREARCDDATRYGVLDDFWGALRDRRRRRWSTCASGAGCTSTRRRRRPSCARRRSQIARDVWNEYFAPVFGRRDVVLLGDLLAHDLVTASTCPTTRSAS